MKFWHITTDHLSDRILFRREEDFKVGMNYVAVAKQATGVSILAFILMSNHVHFVLECSREKALEFITRFKGLHSRYLQRQYGLKEFLRRNDVTINPLSPYDDSLKNAIAYVLMNSVGARLCIYANDYQWGSGAVYFSSRPIKGIALGTLSIRAQKQVLRSWEALPGEWILTEDGYISPASYVATAFVEKLFGTPGSMKYYLDKSSKAKGKRETWEALPSFSDQTVTAAYIDLKRTMFNKKEHDNISEEDNSELAIQLKRRFSCDINQICRITGLSYEACLKIFDRF